MRKLKEADINFNDRYFPRVDLSNRLQYQYYKYKGKDFAYDYQNSLVLYLFKEDEEIAELGRSAPWRELDAVGLSKENWKNIEVRNEYLDEYIFNLDEEASSEFYENRGDRKMIRRIKESFDDYDYEPDLIIDDEFDTFIEDGREFRWLEEIDSTYARDAYGDMTRWAVKSAEDIDTGETVYFVVDTDSDFIDWGPEDSKDAAIEFLNDKENDYDDEEDEDDDYIW